MIDDNELNIDWSDWDNKEKLKQRISYTNTIAMAKTIESLVEIIYETRAAQSQTNHTMAMITQRLEDLSQQIYLMKIEKMGSGPTE